MNVQKVKIKKTQSDRRAETQQIVLASACKIFGEKGYAATSLEEIAADAKVTVSPIYHYFGNKLNLFVEVNKTMEEKLVLSLTTASSDNIQYLWGMFLETCKVPGFVQIVLLDAPHVLGRDQWIDSIVVNSARELLITHYKEAYIFKDQKGEDAFSSLDQDIIIRMLLAALAELALMIGKNPDYDSGRIMRRVQELLKL